MIQEHLGCLFSKEGRAPKTVNEYRGALRALYNYALTFLDYVPGDPRWPNPAARTKRMREPAPEITFLTAEQIDEQLEALEKVAREQEARLAKSLANNYPGSLNKQYVERMERGPKTTRQMRVMVATYIFAGLRRAEATWLTREDVLLEGERPVIQVRAKTIDGEFWQPKTRVNRSVPISQRLLPILTEHAATLSEDAVWFFPSPTGERWSEDNFSADFREHQKRAGLKWRTLDFRHTFGTHLARNGVSLYKISKLMGNSPEICRRHYASVISEDLVDEVEFGA